MRRFLQLTGWTVTLGQLLAAPALQAQGLPAAEAKPAPRIQFSETTWNFGKAQQTAPLKHDFIVTNLGNAPLLISEVRPGCGCTTAGDWDREIAPGKTGRIPIQFNPSSFGGPVSKSVTVTCNDPAQATHYLAISGTIWRPIDIQPQYVHFMPAEDEITNETRIVKIINNTEEDAKLEEPKSSSAVFTTELKTIKPGKEWELHISYSGPVSNAPNQAGITINSSATPGAPVSVSAFAMPQPAFTIMPQPLQLPAGPVTPDYRLPLMIRKNGASTVKLSEPAVNIPGVTATIQESEPGKAFTLALSFPAKFEMTAGQTGELTVKTTHPKHPVLKVPITQAPRAAGLPVPVTTPTAVVK